MDNLDNRGIQRLNGAILLRALEDIKIGDLVLSRANRRPNNKHREQVINRENALAWLRSEDLAWPFSFLNVCLKLGLNASRIRREQYKVNDYRLPEYRSKRQRKLPIKCPA